MLPVLRLMNQQVAVSHYVLSADTFEHEPLYTAPVTVPARIEFTPSAAFGKDGNDIPSYAVVYTIADVRLKDKITLPDGTEREVVSAKRMHDRDGKFSHSVVTV